MRIQNALILLTGANGGIGSAIARRLAAGGAQLLLVGRSQIRLDVLIASLPCHGKPHVAVYADITTPVGRAAIERALEDADQALNALINCAGISQFGLLADTRPEAIERLLATNVTAPILLTQIGLRHLDPDAGRIINIGSTLGGIGYPGFSAYSASKFALRGFTEALRRELADAPLQVAYLAPRATRTALNSDAVCAMNESLGNAMDSPERVADEVERMLGSKRMRNRAIGWPERLFLRVNSILPSLVDGALRKPLAQIKQFADPKRAPSVPIPSTVS
ncbi:MAG: SDR family oxidoreductase [Pseudomarimonas sp.]